MVAAKCKNWEENGVRRKTVSGTVFRYRFRPEVPVMSSRESVEITP
jgi:hypothetical protein